MIDNFLNDLKVKRFMAFGKEANFDLIRKLEAEGLIEKKNTNDYQLTKDGYKAADMGYSEYHLSLDLETKKTTTAPTKYPIKKAHIISIIVKWWWTFIIPLIIVIIGLYIQKLYF
jgi:hypothetical protein